MEIDTYLSKYNKRITNVSQIYDLKEDLDKLVRFLDDSQSSQLEIRDAFEFFVSQSKTVLNYCKLNTTSYNDQAIKEIKILDSQGLVYVDGLDNICFHIPDVRINYEINNMIECLEIRGLSFYIDKHRIYVTGSHNQYTHLVHPHVHSDGVLCLGDETLFSQRLISGGFYTALYDLVKAALSNYSDDNPVELIERFLGYTKGSDGITWVKEQEIPF